MKKMLLISMTLLLLLISITVGDTLNRSERLLVFMLMCFALFIGSQVIDWSVLERNMTFGAIITALLFVVSCISAIFTDAWQFFYLYFPLAEVVAFSVFLCTSFAFQDTCRFGGKIIVGMELFMMLVILAGAENILVSMLIPIGLVLFMRYKRACCIGTGIVFLYKVLMAILLHEIVDIIVVTITVLFVLQVINVAKMIRTSFMKTLCMGIAVHVLVRLVFGQYPLSYAQIPEIMLLLAIPKTEKIKRRIFQNV